MQKFTGKKIELEGWGTIRTFTKRDCERQASEWRRYYEDFMRCHMDPINEHPQFSKWLRILIIIDIYIATAIILLGMYFQWRM